MRQLIKTISVAAALTAAVVAIAMSATSARAECDARCFQRQVSHQTAYRHHHSRKYRSVRTHRSHRYAHQRRAAGRIAYDANGNAGTTIIGGRPADCPHRYCGCGLRKYLGIADKRLNLAWNWARLFPHTAPTPGAAAVRRGHVMLLVSHVRGSVWVVRDYNSGGGLSRIHARSVAGYVFVTPGRG